MRQKYIVTMLSGKIHEVYADDFSVNPNVPEVLIFLQNTGVNVSGGNAMQMAVTMFNLKNIESLVIVDDTGRPLHDRKVEVVVSNLIMNS